MNIRYFCLLILFSMGCAQSSTKSPPPDGGGQRVPAVEAAQASFTDCQTFPRINEECLQPQEKEKFDRQATRVGEAIKTIASKKGGDPQRGFHAKSHGCLKGELIIDPANLGKDYGLFSYGDDKAKSYPVWVRFSNGMPMNFPDALPDFRGMAIKVMNIEVDQDGRMAKHQTQDVKTSSPSKPILKNQDFIMINSPTPILKTSEEAVQLMEALAEMSKGSFFDLIGFIKDHSTATSAVFEQVRFFISSLPRETYYSGAPLRLGDNHAVKLRATPCKQNAPTLLGPAFKEKIGTIWKIRDPLRADLAQKALRRELCFSIDAQFQEDAHRQPLEDASVVWDSEFHHIGHLSFEKQKVIQPSRDQFCQQLSFSPWNGLSEHRPLGEVMRARQAIYSKSQNLRHSAKEPTGEEQF